MKLPKDLDAGKRAYDTYYLSNPQVPFEALNHDFQMHWVRVARSVIDSVRSYLGPGRKAKADGKGEDNFWTDIHDMEPEEFLKKYVPKPIASKPGSGRQFRWANMPPDRRRAAKRVYMMMRKHSKTK